MPQSNKNNMPISVLNLPTQVTNVLNRAQIFTVSDLMQYSLESLLDLKGLGPIRVNLICEQLENVLQLFLPVIRVWIFLDCFHGFVEFNAGITCVGKLSTDIARRS